MDDNHTRRRLLATASGLTAAMLAGCFGSSDNDDTNSGDGGGSTAGTGGNGEEGAPAGWPSYGYDVQNTGYHPTTTGPKNGVEQAWSTDIDAAVDAPPVIADGTAFWVGSTDDGGVVYATDTADGTELWTATTESGFSKPPAVADGTVVAEDGLAVTAFDAATGDQQWTADIQPSTTPLVHDGSVYVLGVDERSVAVTDYFIYEIDADTGEYEVLKEYSRDEDEGGKYSMDFSDSFAVAGDTLVFTNRGAVRALNLETGDEKWVFEGESVNQMYERCPTIAGDTVYVTSSYFRGETSTIFAIDIETGEESWRYTDSELNGNFGEPSVADGTVYVPHLGELYAFATDTGKERWSTELSSEYGVDLHRKPLVADGVVYVNTSKELWAIDATTSDMLWVRALADGKTFRSGTPVVLDDTLYYSAEGDSYSLDVLEEA